MRTLSFVLAVAAPSLLMAAEYPATTEDFIEVCMSSSNLPVEICKCAGDRATNQLSDDGFDFLVAGLRGDRDALERLQRATPSDELMAAGMFMVDTPAECAAEIGNQ